MRTELEETNWARTSGFQKVKGSALYHWPSVTFHTPLNPIPTGEAVIIKVQRPLTFTDFAKYNQRRLRMS